MGQTTLRQDQHEAAAHARRAIGDARPHLYAELPGVARRLDVGGVDVKRTMRWLIGAGTRRIADADLRCIETPTALVWGGHDRMVPVRLAERAHASFGWPLSVIDDSGHVPFLERPDEFLAALTGALDPQSSTTQDSTTHDRRYA
jgi:pimeloyl-ACP methyl ester carboxylesterase